MAVLILLYVKSAFGDGNFGAIGIEAITRVNSTISTNRLQVPAICIPAPTPTDPFGFVIVIAGNVIACLMKTGCECALLFGNPVVVIGTNREAIILVLIMVGSKAAF